MSWSIKLISCVTESFPCHIGEVFGKVNSLLHVNSNHSRIWDNRSDKARVLFSLRSSLCWNCCFSIEVVLICRFLLTFYFNKLCDVVILTTEERLFERFCINQLRINLQRLRTSFQLCQVFKHFMSG